MKIKTILALGFGTFWTVAILGMQIAPLANGQTPGAAPQHPMTFFVTSSTPTGTGSLGGLEGADRICQNLAMAVGTGNHTWHAYLSTQPKPENGNGVEPRVPGVNARDRIGPGPWYNQKGVLIAISVEDLHGDIQRDSNNIKANTALTEKGQPAQAIGSGPNALGYPHDILTGSDSHGRAFSVPGIIDTTCSNWTADDPNHRTVVGHADRNGGVNTSWNSAHPTKDCTKAGFIEYGGAGLFYCFAIN
jgi:hypothetical protein